jgi:hypothetical protein
MLQLFIYESSIAVKNVQCTDQCTVCEDGDEDSTHLFFICIKSVFCWQRTALWNLLMNVFDPAASFPTNVFAILQLLDQQQMQVFGMTFWSIWTHRNNKVWNNIIESAQSICERAGSFLTSWMNAQNIRNHTTRHSHTQGDLKWHKPSLDTYKCNVDISFSFFLNRVGLDMCI